LARTSRGIVCPVVLKKTSIPANAVRAVTVPVRERCRHAGVSKASHESRAACATPRFMRGEVCQRGERKRRRAPRRRGGSVRK